MLPWIDVSGSTVRTSHLVLLITVVVCACHGARQWRGVAPSDWRKASRGLVLLAAAPWVGGHLHFVLANWRFARTRPEILFIPWNGLHAAGAVIALTITLPLVARRYRLPVGLIADALVPTVGLGIVLGRLSCFVEGCCAGRACELPWCIAFPPGADVYTRQLALGQIHLGATQSAAVHPLQLYFAAIGAMLYGLSSLLTPRRRYPGEVALIGLLGFALAAAALEPLRGGDDARVYWGPLPQLQWVALALACGSAVTLYVAERRGSRSVIPAKAGI